MDVRIVGLNARELSVSYAASRFDLDAPYTRPREWRSHLSLATTAEQAELADVALRFAHAQELLATARHDAGEKTDWPPAHWSELVNLGWLGLGIGPEFGGEGGDLHDVAVLLESLASGLSSAPLLPTVHAIHTLARCGSPAQRLEYLGRLLSGEQLGAVALIEEDGPDTSQALAYGGRNAALFLLPRGKDLFIVHRTDPSVTVQAVDDLDLTRRSARITWVPSEIPVDRRIDEGLDGAREIGWILSSAEAMGCARACLDMAVTYAGQRVQFGRTIGSFQAVKHLLADMLIATELGAAAAWDAARPAGSPDEARLAASCGAVVALSNFVEVAKRLIQVLGGIGYTWEHNAHLFFRRSLALRAFYGAERDAPSTFLGLFVSGVTRHQGIEMPLEAERFREEVRAFAQQVRREPETERRKLLLDAGYLVPHWPKPWGRDATAIEQIVIAEELEELAQLDLSITGWIALTLAQNATSEQCARWIGPMLMGEDVWCQLFSEPEAGSDAAAVRTRGHRVDGGWSVTGSKIWTSGAHLSRFGLATVRTAAGAKKHDGLTAMVIDMNAPGVNVAPLRDMTGGVLFNEVQFDSAFVSDRDVVGAVGDGWRVARSTFGNERVSIGDRIPPARSARTLFPLLSRISAVDAGWDREAALLLAQEHALESLNLLQTVRAVNRRPTGAEGSVSKLYIGELVQRIAELGARIAGESGLDGSEPNVAELVLFSRAMTIAGGTSEILRDQLAERVLGLPRDPLKK